MTHDYETIRPPSRWGGSPLHYAPGLLGRGRADPHRKDAEIGGLISSRKAQWAGAGMGALKTPLGTR